jgi:hypothetical protein
MNLEASQERFDNHYPFEMNRGFEQVTDVQMLEK